MTTGTPLPAVDKSWEFVKIATYRRHSPHLAATFIPFACKMCDTLDPAAQAFVKKIATHVAQFTKWSYPSFLREFLPDMGIAIQRGNVLLWSN